MSERSILMEMEPNGTKARRPPKPTIKVVREIRQWTCDVCGRAFPTFEEACTHEEKCKQNQQQAVVAAETVLLEVEKQKQQHSSSKAVSSAKASSSDVRKKSSKASSSSSKSTNQQQQPPSCASKTKVAPKSQSSKQQTLTAAFLKPKTTNQGSRSTQRQQGKKRSLIDLTLSSSSSSCHENHPQQQKPKSGTSNKSAKRAKTNDKQQQEQQPSLASIIQAAGVRGSVDDQVLLQEQAAAQFRAKRLQKEQRQRELQLKKQKQLQKHQRGQEVAKQHQSSLPKKKHVAVAAPRFPVPSHLVASTIPDDSSSRRVFAADSAIVPWLKPSDLAHARVALQQPRVPMGFSSHSSYSTQSQSYDDNVDMAAPRNRSLTKEPETALLACPDPLQSILARTLIPPPRKVDEDSNCSSSSSGNQLWADKYYNSSSFTLENPTRLALQKFLEEWMSQRHQSHLRRKERQDKLLAIHRPQQKMSAKKRSAAKNQKRCSTKKCYDEDDEPSSSEEEVDHGDELWCDDDEGDDSKLDSLFLLTGPVGAGKTALVHAVAKQYNQEVLEINTSDKRGAATLRKLVEETTQSHSSMDLLKTKEQQQLQEYLKVTTRPDETATLETEEDAATDVVKEAQTKLTLILLDEADLLYDDDAGFWGALNDLSKRSKCPIVLTANKIPPGIRSCHHYTFMELSRPDSNDCAEMIRRIVEKEGFEWKVTDVADHSRFLASFAALCNYDIRRLCHELQLFSHSSRDHALATGGAPTSLATSTSSPTPELPAPKISSVDPREVRWEDYVLLTIHGSGFLSLACSPSLGGGGYPVVVSVGEQICPHARIVNDSIIHAVKAPCPTPLEVDQPLRCLISRRPFSAEYKAITLMSTKKLGLLSTTKGSISRLKSLCAEGASFLSMDKPCNLVCHFSSVQVVTQGDSSPSCDNGDSEDEFEFALEGGNREKSACVATTLMPTPAPPIDWKRAAKILKDGLDKWKMEIPPVDDHKPTPVDDSSTVDSLARQAGLASDAAFLEDVCCTGVPHLAGACRGFGFDLTEAFPSTMNKSKPPSEDRLYSLRWKDDCYFYGDNDSLVTRPSTPRERTLLRLLESSCGQDPAPLNKDTVDEMEGTTLDGEFRPTEYTEADSLIPNQSPSCIQSFTSYLLQTCRPLPDAGAVEEHLLGQARETRMQEQLDLLHSYLFAPEFYRAHLFARGLSRQVDTLLPPQDVPDLALFLDYLPLLRVMAVIDMDVRAALALSQKSDDASDTKPRRSTRNSQRKDNHHFLAKLLPHSQFNDELGPDSVAMIVERLSRRSLLKLG